MTKILSLDEAEELARIPFDEEMDQEELIETHRKIDEIVTQLQKSRYVSPEMQNRIKILKKMKLRIKDRIYNS